MTALTEPHRMLGRYALFGEMATGGMASVHLGRLLGSAGFARTVVIKRMKAELAEDNEFVEMFVDEARLASRVQHPNVVSTLDVVRDGQELFIVMDYVHGKSLDELIMASSERSSSIPPRIVSAIGVNALLGLHAAHEATSESGEPLHLVHRDFSPHNVLIDVDGAARVVDFGVAKAAQKLHKTRDGQVKGKWAYMSPEQVAGEELDRRSDLFAAGIVLWEALTCERLFFHENPARMATAITYKEAPPPSSVAEACPAALDEVVLKALAKDPRERFSSAREMAKALRSAVMPTDVLDVSSWLEDLVGDGLDALAKRVAAIEKASASLVEVPASAAVSLIDSSVSSDVSAEIAATREAAREQAAREGAAGQRETAGRKEAGREEAGRKEAGQQDAGRKTAGREAVAVRPKTLIGGTRMHRDNPDEAVVQARDTVLEPADDVAAVIAAHKSQLKAGAFAQTAAPSTPKVTPDRDEQRDSVDTSGDQRSSVEPTAVSSRDESRDEAGDERTMPKVTARSAGVAEPPSEVQSESVREPQSEREPESTVTVPMDDKRRIWALLLLVALIAIAAAVLSRESSSDTRGRAETSPAAPPSGAKGAEVAPRPAPSGRTMPSASPDASAQRNVDPAPTARPRASGATTSLASPSPSSPPPGAPPSSPSSPTSRPNKCDPPFTLRADGVKVFKPECF